MYLVVRFTRRDIVIFLEYQWSFNISICMGTLHSVSMPCPREVENGSSWKLMYGGSVRARPKKLISEIPR